MQKIEIKDLEAQVSDRVGVRTTEIRIGDRVKVLVKETYGDGHTVYPGVVVGFEPFKTAPTLIIAYAEISYSSADIKFLHFNHKTENKEIIRAIDNDHLDLKKSSVLDAFERMILKKREEVRELEQKRNFFLDQFQQYWSPVTPVVEPEIAQSNDSDS